MTYVLCAIILAQMLLFAWERARQIQFMANDHLVWHRFVGDLLQRIQAPQDAVYTHSLAASDAAPPAQPLVMGLPFDDDEAFHETKEQLAERLVD